MLGIFGIGVFGICVGMLSSVLNSILDRITAKLTFITKKMAGLSDKKAVARLRARTKTLINVCLIIGVWLSSSLVFARFCQLDFGNAVYYTAATYYTIGLGDYSVPWQGDVASASVFVFIFLASLGIASFAVFINITTELIAVIYSEVSETLEEFEQKLEASFITSNDANAKAPSAAIAVDKLKTQFSSASATSMRTVTPDGTVKV